VTDAKPDRHRFPMTVIQHTIWLDHHFSPCDRDVHELLHQRGTQLSHQTLREWCINFGPLFAQDLRHRESRRVGLPRLCRAGVKQLQLGVRTPEASSSPG
jgi:putative transposase